ncbi:MAG: helix-turn-helix domain-containing protein [Clostridium sp.]|jgi:transcriptional regulator with XRE-family HTH domain|nr:helix-turn-helix domain-containing protein [Clostridium sp.]
MKEINIARSIVKMRREKGMTQEDLANYIGVSKASVSKWETGQSYPDITFLPQLATLFNISIDELMGYEPQMSKEDIRELYVKLSADFASKPFDEVLDSCREIAKKYFSCFPLLFHIGALLVNNSTESGDKEKTLSVLAEAKELFVRVKTESEDAELVQLSICMEAYCALMMGNPNEVIELLEGTRKKIISNETLLASAYQMVGKSNEAKMILQVAIYQHMCNLFKALTDYLILCTDNPEQFDKTLKRANDIAEAFDLKKLHPSFLIMLYNVAAQGYMMLGSKERALEILEKYTELVTGDIYPLQLKGDEYFNLIDQWIEELNLGIAPPRNEKIIRKSIADGVINNPVFSTLADEIRFKRIAEKLKNNC